MALRLVRLEKNLTPARITMATAVLPPLRWLGNALGLLTGAALLAWLVVHFSL